MGDQHHQIRQQDRPETAGFFIVFCCVFKGFCLQYTTTEVYNIDNKKEGEKTMTRTEMIKTLESIAKECGQYEPEYTYEREELMNEWNTLIPEAHRLGITGLTEIWKRYN